MKRLYTLLFLIILLLGSHLFSKTAQAMNLVERIKQQGLGELGEIRITEYYPNSKKAVVVIGESHIGQSQAAEVKLLKHLIANQKLKVIYTEGMDEGYIVDVDDYYATFKSAKSILLLKQVAMEMVKSDEISAVEYIKLIYPKVRVIGVTNRGAFDSFVSRQGTARKALKKYLNTHREELKPHDDLVNKLMKEKLFTKIDEGLRTHYFSISKKIDKEIMPQIINKIQSNWQFLSYDEQNTINNLSIQIKNNPDDQDARLQLSNEILQIGMEKAGWLTMQQKKIISEFKDIEKIFIPGQETNEEINFQIYNKTLQLALDVSDILTTTESKNIRELLHLRTKLKPILIEVRKLSNRVNNFNKQEMLEERDLSMIKNLVQLMEQNDDREAVLIVGAAHNPGIITFLKQYQITHALVSPANTCVKWKTDTECFQYYHEINEQSVKIE